MGCIVQALVPAQDTGGRMIALESLVAMLIKLAMIVLQILVIVVTKILPVMH